MTYDGKNYLASFRGIFMLVFIIMAILFCYVYNIGIFIVLGLILYFMLFMSRDKKMKKEELDKMLSRKESRIIYSRIMPKEIP